MTDKIEVPRELMEKLLDCALTCDYDHKGEGCRQIAAQCDALLRKAERPECCGNPAQCWEPCGELGKSAEHAAVAPDEELRRDAERMKFAAEAPNLHGQVYLSCRLRGAAHQQALDLAHDAEKMYGAERVSEADLHIILAEISDAIDAAMERHP